MTGGLVDVAPAAPPPAPPRPDAAPRPVASPASRAEPWLLAGLVACGLLAVWWATEPNYFFADDWMNLALARASRAPTWAELTASYFGHLAPGHRLLDRLVAQRHTISWELAVGVMLAGYAGCLLAFHQVLRELRIAPGARLAATAAYAASVTWVGTTQWWANAAHVEPATLGLLVALAAALRWTRTRARALLVAAPLAMVLGALFYERALFAVAWFGLLRAFVLPRRLRVREVVAVVRTDLPMLAAMGLAAAVVVGGMVAGGYSSVGPPAALDAWMAYVPAAWLRGTMVLLVGQHGGWAPLGAVVAAQAVLLALVAVSVALRPAAWRAWAFWFLAWGVLTAGVGHARLGAFGLNVAITLRYAADWGFLLPLTIVLAFRRDPDDAPRPAAGAAVARAIGTVPTRVRQAVAVAIGLALLGSSASAWIQAVPGWPSHRGRAWIDTLRREIAAARAHGPVVLLDAPVPATVVAWLPPPEGVLSGVMPLVDDTTRVGADVARPWAVTDDGGLRPALVELAWQRAAATFAGPATLQGRARVVGDVVCAKGRGTRLAVDTPPMTTRWQLRVTVRPAARERWMRLDDDAASTPGRPRAMLRVGRGARHGWTLLGTAGAERVWLTVPRGTCVTALQLAALA